MIRKVNTLKPDFEDFPSETSFQIQQFRVIFYKVLLKTNDHQLKLLASNICHILLGKCIKSLCHCHHQRLPSNGAVFLPRLSFSLSLQFAPCSFVYFFPNSCSSWTGLSASLSLISNRLQKSALQLWVCFYFFYFDCALQKSSQTLTMKIPSTRAQESRPIYILSRHKARRRMSDSESV